MQALRDKHMPRSDEDSGSGGSGGAGRRAKVGHPPASPPDCSRRPTVAQPCTHLSPRKTAFTVMEPARYPPRRSCRAWWPSTAAAAPAAACGGGGAAVALGAAAASASMGSATHSAGRSGTGVGAMVRCRGGRGQARKGASHTRVRALGKGSNSMGLLDCVLRRRTEGSYVGRAARLQPGAAAAASGRRQRAVPSAGCGCTCSVPLRFPLFPRLPPTLQHAQRSLQVHPSLPGSSTAGVSRAPRATRAAAPSTHSAPRLVCRAAPLSANRLKASRPPTLAVDFAAGYLHLSAASHGACAAGARAASVGVGRCC